MSTIRKETLEAQLTGDARLHLFQRLGFRTNGHVPDGRGWISGVLGPKELGEGEKGNFSINIHTGAVKDHGSTGYTGDLFGCVQTVRRCSFAEALQWIAEQVGFTGNGSPPQRTRKPPRRRMVATYDYTDAQGHLLF